MVDGILRTNSGHPLNSGKEPGKIISLGDPDADLGRTHAASDLMRRMNLFDYTEATEGSDAHPDRREAPRSSL